MCASHVASRMMPPKSIWLLSQHSVHAVGPHLHEGLLQPPRSDDDTLGCKTTFGMVLYRGEPQIVPPRTANACQGSHAAWTNYDLLWEAKLGIPLCRVDRPQA
jgi:hypothetical protein